MIVGWDLGGVHVKAALVESARVRDAVQVPCALWRGLSALEESLAALPDWARGEAAHAVTMTGELCDCFASRAEGVAALAAWSAERLVGKVLVYAGRKGFLAPDRAADHVGDIASANWHASAALLARQLDKALLVDIGSTTSDLIPIRFGKPAAQGYSDAERLVTGELVYTGVVRTPVMAFGAKARFRGRLSRLMAEHFCAAADVYRLLERLPPEADQQESADGRGKSRAETETRLARIVGCDRADASSEAWRDLAATLAAMQLDLLSEAASEVLARAGLTPEAPIVGCGVGRFLARDLAARHARPYADLADLVPGTAAREWVASCAPAVAVALLAGLWLGPETHIIGKTES